MIFDGSFSLYEGNAFAKFRRKSARAQLGGLYRGPTRKSRGSLVSVPRIDNDSLFQATRQIAIATFVFSFLLPLSVLPPVYSRPRAVSEHPRRVRCIIYRVATTNAVGSEQRQLIIQTRLDAVPSITPTGSLLSLVPLTAPSVPPIVGRACTCTANYVGV